MRAATILLETLNDHSATSRDNVMTVGELLDRLDRASFSLVALLLSLPFLQPVSIGPLATVGGLVFAGLGVQLWRGQSTPWVPERVRGIGLSSQTWSRLLKVLEWVVRFFGKITRRRKEHWVSGRTGDKVVGALFVAGGLLIAIPFVGIPFNNTLPAFVVVSAAIGELEHDGYMVPVALGFLVASILYFALLLGTFWVVVSQTLL